MNLKALARWLRPTTKHETGPLRYDLRSVSRTHVGRVRAINEDRVLEMPEHRLWAVAGGMGGHAAGDIAAEAAITALQRVALDGPVDVGAVETALGEVNRRLHDSTLQGAPMSGATIVVMLERDREVTILWAGDCRAYRLRVGQLVQLTRDHSVVQDLLDAGVIDATQAAQHPHAHMVTRALGADEDVPFDRIVGKCQTGDRFLLCSDGLMPAPAKVRDLMQASSARMCDTADGLIADALQSGGNDNISLVLIEFV